MKLPIGQIFSCIVCKKKFECDGDSTIFCSVKCESDFKLNLKGCEKE